MAGFLQQAQGVVEIASLHGRLDFGQSRRRERALQCACITVKPDHGFGVAFAQQSFEFAQRCDTGGGAGNRILPKGDPGTGIYLVGRDNTAGGALRGNTIGAYYTEVTERPLYARNGGVIRGSSAFFQGRAASPFPAAIVLDNTRLVFGTVTVRMPFTNLFAGENKASCGVELLDAPHAKAKTDATSRLKVNTAMGE